MTYAVEPEKGIDGKPRQWCYKIMDDGKILEKKCNFKSEEKGKIAARKKIAGLLGNTDILDNID